MPDSLKKGPSICTSNQGSRIEKVHGVIPDYILHESEVEFEAKPNVNRNATTAPSGGESENEALEAADLFGTDSENVAWSDA